MKNFHEALISKQKHDSIPAEYDYFTKLIGSWDITYEEVGFEQPIIGEWHFSWILDGMAIQDVILLPGYENGTSLRLYNPKTCAWDVAYGFTGNIIQLEARKQEDRIELTFINDKRRKWMFTKIEDTEFYWQNVTVQDNGEWYILAKIHAKRR